MTQVQVAPGVWRRRWTLEEVAMRGWVGFVRMADGDVVPVDTVRTVQ